MVPVTTTAVSDCSAFTWQANYGQYFNRRCGLDDPEDLRGLKSPTFSPWAADGSAGRSWGDRSSALCAGSDERGVLRGITEAEMQARCAQAGAGCHGYAVSMRGWGPHCNVYSPTPCAGFVRSDELRLVPFTGWRNYVGRSYTRWMSRKLEEMPGTSGIGNWTSWRKQSTCVVRSHAPKLTAAMQHWAAQWRGLAREAKSSDHVSLAAHLHTLRRMVRDQLPKKLAELPLFYPLGGADLLTAAAVAPNATHHILSAALPLGDPACFLSTACRTFAKRAVMLYFRYWSFKHFAWTETAQMQRWLEDEPATGLNASLGVLPVLVASLGAMGHTITGIEAHGAASLTLHAGSLRVTFVERMLIDPELDTLILDAALDGRRHVTLIKAAAPDASFLFNPKGSRWMQWLLNTSAAVVSDVSGPLPSRFSKKAGWRVRLLGNLSSTEEAYARLHITRAGTEFGGEMRRMWPANSEELPTVWGYGLPQRAPSDGPRDRHGYGAMIVAWRDV